MSDECLFADEPDEAMEQPAPPAGPPPEPWLVLIVDDDASIHAATRMVLRGVNFRGRPLKCLRPIRRPRRARAYGPSRRSPWFCSTS